MAKIFDLAQTAGVTPRTLLDVVNGKPVNEDARQRVAAAIAELGQPDRPVGAFRHLDIVSAEPEEPGGSQAANSEIAQRSEPLAHDDLATGILEALRAEVQPVGAHLDRLDASVAEVVRCLQVERRDRTDDVELLSELAIEGWRGVERRLGRVEKILARIEEAQQTSKAQEGRSVKRLEDWIRD